MVSFRIQVQTDFQQVEANKILITIPNADDINHLVVFLTGVQPLPQHLAGAVYFSFPDPLSPPSWIYLGFICNEKPSAIFKINKLKKMSVNGERFSLANLEFNIKDFLPLNMIGFVSNSNFGYTQPIVSHVAQIGISIEPKLTVAQMTPDSSINETDSGTKFEQFATKMAENLFNYCSSFSNPIAYYSQNFGANLNEQLVPLNRINDWYARFLRTFKQNPNFWV